jgi:hypothetical protein
MKKLTCLGYFCLIAMLLVSTSVWQARAQQKGFKQARRTTFLTSHSGQQESAQRVRSNEETVKAGKLTTGEAVSVGAGDAPGLKAARRNPSQKVTKADRPASKQGAEPQMEMSGGLEAARAAVSPRESFGGKQ